jgi:formate--tetrahydrofolate ligase
MALMDTTPRCIPSTCHPREKIRAIARRAYGAADVQFSPEAQKQIARFVTQGFGGLPVCMAKTQNSLSDDPKRLGRPTGFTLTVREVLVSAGAGFLVAITGDIMRMPGLPRHPQGLALSVDAHGRISGLGK